MKTNSVRFPFIEVDKLKICNTWKTTLFFLLVVPGSIFVLIIVVGIIFITDVIKRVRKSI